MEIKIPKLCLVVLIGPSGCGKSTFAKKHFLPTEVVSSDFCRALVCDDENNQRATPAAFEVLYLIARKRLAAGRLTVIDATNVQPEDRESLIVLARQYYCNSVAIVFDLPGEILEKRSWERTDRDIPSHVIPRQLDQMRRSLGNLKNEGFRFVFQLDSEAAVNSAVVKRLPLSCDKSHLTGPFDIIGDVHGCYDELEELLGRLGYDVTGNNEDDPMKGPIFSHPRGRIVVFLGDIVDRGPRIIDCIKLVYNMVKFGSGLCVPGNHDMKFLRKLKGRDVRIAHGLENTLAEVDALPGEIRDSFKREVLDFLEGLTSHYVLDRRRLVVAHAGIKRGMQGRSAGGVREFCLYGETTGEVDELGLPIRSNWAENYRGKAMVVYGHTPVPKVEWVNNTVNIDTGCVFGGKLTALRYPEREFVSVPRK
ncbi:MAG: AAA family ATPase [Candidatus Aminicenantes bacterium]|nr:MAG: AAA family ATPase [Candidatus Aminicenantes bacterium]